jgi:hypothetical protein
MDGQGRKDVMETNRTGGTEVPGQLATLLRQTLVEGGLPPGFHTAVWARIRAGGSDVGWREVVAWLFRPRWSVALLVVLFAAGVWRGWKAGHQEALHASERRYVLALEPESSPF